MTYLIVSLMIGMLLLGTPLYVFLFGISAYLFWTADIPLLSTVVSFQKLQSQEFVYAIPLFTFAGYLLSRSQSPARIIRFVQTCFHFLPSSASILTVIVMALFTALTGASGVTILAMGGLLFPLLKKASGKEIFAHGLITASGSIGLLLAPSLPVIIYTVIANQNLNSGGVDLNTLFNNALIPSLLVFTAFIAYSFFQEKQHWSSRYTWTQVKDAVKGARWEIPLPFLVYGGIYSGFFTVLEAAVLVALYTTMIIFLIYQDLSFTKDFIAVTIDSLKLSGGIFIIMATAFVLTNYLIYERIPDRIFEWISPYLTNRITFLIAINILLLITGCFLDIFSAILIILPLLLPVVERYQIDPYHFALIFLINLEIGYLTPPVGLNLFISSYSFKKPITYLYRSILPFLFLLLLILMTVTYVPSLATWFSTTATTADSQPPAIETMSVTKVKTEAVEISIVFEKNLPSGLRLYFLDEEDADKNMVLDFGEYRDFRGEWDKKERTALIRLTDLIPSSPYTLMAEPLVEIDGVEKSGLPWGPISFTTSSP